MAAPSTQIDAWSIVPGFRDASSNADKAALVAGYFADLDEGPPIA